MIIGDFNVNRITSGREDVFPFLKRGSGLPGKTNPILGVYPDAVLLCPVSPKGFESIRWRIPQISQDNSGL